MVHSRSLHTRLQGRDQPQPVKDAIHLCFWPQGFTRTGGGDRHISLPQSVVGSLAVATDCGQLSVHRTTTEDVDVPQASCPRETSSTR